ncbi:H-NS family nucleoid-associated regulatory protein [Caballeronia novacaledonica]|uniref:H-NS histone family protein n=1 Tax=Caballeronia novacaledonica TaxID=1544861 RepID=A0AA37ICZ5_9BURK|nr:H-NS family nucleoid-associated regulatory protein [Caballeronia novacaledonica]GJH26974.1 H-NS histone family protein [Caballeronia novacaledonica]
MATLEAIQARIKKLEAQAQALKAKSVSGVLKQIHDLMDRHEISMEDVSAFVGKAARSIKAKATGKAVSARYVDPKTGASWSGRGRAPAWIANARDRSAFLADGTAPVENPKATVTRRKAARKGPQPALYHDPVSGNTWSGFGRAPSWIATAKDRSTFLIAGNAVASESGRKANAAPAKKTEVAKKTQAKAVTTAKKAAPAVKKAAAKKVTAKKATAKKTAAKKVASKEVTVKKAAAAKKGAATKSEGNSAASQRARSTRVRSTPKASSTAQSVAPAPESLVQSAETEAQHNAG